MDSLRPRETFPIVRGLPDHTDSGTYYVRAIIKRAIDDSIIDTVNLVNKGGRYFSYNWETPADVSGEGFYITITTSVYTDAGYTTKADGYGDEFQTYLVADRPNVAQILGGSGGGGVSYAKIKEIVSAVISEALGALPKPIKPKDVDLSALSDLISQGFNNMAGKFKEIPMPGVPEKVDYSKIESAIKIEGQSILQRIDKINIPEFDYKRIDEKFNNLNPMFSGLVGKLENLISEIQNKNSSEVKDLRGKLEVVGKVKALLSDPTLGGPAEEKKLVNNLPWYRKPKQ